MSRPVVKQFAIVFGAAAAALLLIFEPVYFLLAAVAVLPLLFLIGSLGHEGHNRAAAIAGLFTYVGWMTFVIAGSAIEGVHDRSNHSSCDAFCGDLKTEWAIRIIFGAIFAVVLSGVMWVIVGFIAANRRRSATS